jgi:hypothetical protein
LIYGTLPTELVSVERIINRYRRFIEDEIIAIHGGITVYDAHLVDEAMCGQCGAGVTRWLLVNRFEKMSTENIIACKTAEAKFIRRRNEAVKALGLDPRSHQDSDPSSMYAHTATWNATEVEPATLTTPVDDSPATAMPDAADASVGDQVADGDNPLPSLFD